MGRMSYRAVYFSPAVFQMAFRFPAVMRAASAAGRVQRNQDLKKALENLRISSPRGTLDITALTGSSNAPLYICEVRQAGNSFRNTVVSRASSLQAVEREAHRPALVARSGWSIDFGIKSFFEQP